METLKQYKLPRVSEDVDYDNPIYTTMTPENVQLLKFRMQQARDSLIDNYEFDEHRPFEFVKRQMFVRGQCAILKDLIYNAELHLANVEQDSQSHEE